MEGIDLSALSEQELKQLVENAINSKVGI
ncbi:unnamed protein product [Ectocarpus sp. CCAP 1310/34]|nr:unnamed protein product [Ectocarpus sp. CCAP 1310/34]